MPFSVINWAASLHFAMHSSFVALSARALATRTTLAITANAITATFLIASPFPSPLPPASHFLRSLLALYPAFPFGHLLPKINKRRVSSAVDDSRMERMTDKLLIQMK
jgi:hypothetical protein